MSFCDEFGREELLAMRLVYGARPRNQWAHPSWPTCISAMAQGMMLKRQRCNPRCCPRSEDACVTVHLLEASFGQERQARQQMRAFVCSTNLGVESHEIVEPLLLLVLHRPLQVVTAVSCQFFFELSVSNSKQSNTLKRHEGPGLQVSCRRHTSC